MRKFGKKRPKKMDVILKKENPHTFVKFDKKRPKKMDISLKKENPYTFVPQNEIVILQM